MALPSTVSGVTEATEYICARLDYIEEILASMFPNGFTVGIDDFYQRNINASSLNATQKANIIAELQKVKQKHKNKAK